MGFRVEKLDVVCHARRRTGCTGRPFVLLFDRPRSALGNLPGERVDLTGNPPVMPFRLQDIGYDNVATRTGWLVAAFVSCPLRCKVAATYKYFTSRLASLSVNHNLSRIGRILFKSIMQGPRPYHTLPNDTGIAGTR